MFVSKKEEKKLKKMFKEEFLPTEMGMTYEEYIVRSKLEKEAIMCAFGNWLRKRGERRTM